MNIDNMYDLVHRLSELMVEEVNLLREMNLQQLPPIQQEKEKIVSALEQYQTQIQEWNEKYGESLLDDEEYERFIELWDVFEQICEVNYNELLQAKEVNQVVIGAISDAISANLKSSSYMPPGKEKMDKTKAGPALSVNEKV